MKRFLIEERVPIWIHYTWEVCAETEEEALEIIEQGGANEVDMIFGDNVGMLDTQTSVLYEEENPRRSLWWTANDWAEAAGWITDLTAKGCHVEDVKLTLDRPQVEVVFNLPVNQAEEILGYQPEEEEWLTKDYAA